MVSTWLSLWLALCGLRVSATGGHKDTECYLAGQLIVLNCIVPEIIGILFWHGVGFNCPNTNTVANNQISLLTSTQCIMGEGKCGLYNGTLSCLGNGSLISHLSFVADNSVNGQSIVCTHRTNIIRNITLLQMQDLVPPDRPTSRSVMIPFEGEIHYEWGPPENHATGGIRGYNITSYGNCGSCTPVGMVDTNTFTSTCTGWIAQGQTCQYEIRTVSADCGLQSEPVTLTIILNGPSSVSVIVLCSQDNLTLYQIGWTYQTQLEILVVGFKVVFSDQFGNRYTDFLSDSTTRMKSFNSIEVEAVGLLGTFRTVTVAVQYENGVISSNASVFSVETITTDSSPTLSQRQCIEVSVKSQCNKSANSFQAQLEYTDQMCGTNGTKFTLTKKYSFDENYRQCIPLTETGTICYAARVLYNDMVVGRTIFKQLTLLSCNTQILNLSREINVIVSTSHKRNQEIVPHSTVLKFWCLDFDEIYHTRCVNGSFTPIASNGKYNTCSNGIVNRFVHVTVDVLRNYTVINCLFFTEHAHISCHMTYYQHCNSQGHKKEGSALNKTDVSFLLFDIAPSTKYCYTISADNQSHSLTVQGSFKGYVSQVIIAGESSTVLIGTSITMAITVVMAIFSLTALTASVIVCCKKPHLNEAGEPHPMYYSTVSGVAADPMYEEVSTVQPISKLKNICTEPNEAYRPVSMEPNEAYQINILSTS